MAIVKIATTMWIPAH